MITPGVDQQSVVQYVADTHKKWKSNRLTMEQVWRDCFMYAFSRWKGGGMINTPGSDDQKYYLPAIENMVDTVTAQLCQSVMPGDVFWEILPRTPQFQENADNLNAVLKWAHQKNHFRAELHKMVKQSVITGNSPWHVSWAIRQTSVPDQQQMLKIEEQIRQAQLDGLPPRPMMIPQKPLVTYAGTEFFTSSCFDFVKDPWPEDEKSGTRMRRFFRSPLSIAAMGRKNELGYAIYENAQDIPPANETEMSDNLKQQLKLSIGISGDYEGRDKVEIIECFGDIPVMFEGDTEQTVLVNHVAVIANKNTLLRLEPLPFEHGEIPCDMFKLIDRPGEPYGTGLVERCLGIQDAILDRFTQSIVAHGLAVNPMWFVKPDGMFDPNDFECYPGAVHQYLNEVPKPFEVPDKAMEGFAEVSMLKGEISEATGAIIDLNTKGERSATETSVVARMGNAKFAELSKTLEDTITTVVRQEASLFQQLLSDAIYVRVSHPSNPQMAIQMRPVNGEDILGEFDLNCVGASRLAEGAQQVQQLIAITGAIAQTPAQPFIDWVKYAATIFDMAGLKDAADRFIKPVEQVYAEQQQALLAGGQGIPGPAGPQPGVPGVASVPGVPNVATQGAPAAHGGGVGDNPSAPGRRPLPT